MSNPLTLAGIGAGVTAVVLVSSNLIMVERISKSTNTVQGEISELRSEVTKLRSEVAVLQKAVVYRSAEKIAISTKELDCLAKNIFHEAGIEPIEGKIAVAQVTLNRLKSGRWGKDICSVVFHKAQFSWTNDKKKIKSVPKGPLWDSSVRVAESFVKEGKRIKGLENSGFYHTNYIQPPEWSKSKRVAHKIGQHIFYRGVDA